MTRVEQVVRAAQRRRLARRIISLLGPALAIGAGAALLGALVDRLIGPGLDWWLWLAGPIGLAALVALGWATLTRGGAIDAAVELDTALRLRDRLGSALVLRAAAADDAFAKMAIDDAEEAARGVRVERAIPLRWGNSWAAWPALALAAWAVGFFLPAFDLLGARRAEGSPAQDAARMALAEQLREIVEEVQPPSPDAPQTQRAEDLARGEDDILNDLAEQLLAGAKDSDEVRAEAVDRLNESAEELARRAEQQALREQAARELFNALNNEKGGENGDGAPGAGDALRDRLGQGDLAGAAEAARELEAQLDEMTEEERRAVAEHLEQTAEALDRAASQAERQADAQTEADRQPLEQQGLSREAAEALQSETDPRALQQALENAGMDPEAARRLAEEAARRNAERQARRDAAKDARDAAKEARDLLPDLRKPAVPKSGGADDQPPDQRDPAQAPPREPRDPFAPLNQPPPPANTGNQDPSKRDPQKGEGEGKRPEQQGEPQPGGAPDQNQGSQQSQPGNQQSGGGKQGQQQGKGSQQPANSSTGDSGQGGKGSQGGEQSSGGSSGGSSPGGSSPGGSSPGGSSSGGGGAGSEPGQGSGAGERLDEMAQRAERARRDRERADRLREAARRLGESPGDQEQNLLDRWAAEQAKQTGAGAGPQGGSGDRAGGTTPDLPDGYKGTDTVDARRGGSEGRVAREWINPDAPPTRGGQISDRPMVDGLREAQESAQKGVEERTIPNRYDPVLRKYFEKAVRRAKDAEGKEPAPSEPAPPAPPAPPTPAAKDAAPEKKPKDDTPPQKP